MSSPLSARPLHQKKKCHASSANACCSAAPLPPLEKLHVLMNYAYTLIIISWLVLGRDLCAVLPRPPQHFSRPLPPSSPPVLHTTICRHIKVFALLIRPRLMMFMRRMLLLLPHCLSVCAPSPFCTPFLCCPWLHMTTMRMMMMMMMRMGTQRQMSKSRQAAKKFRLSAKKTCQAVGASRRETEMERERERDSNVA